MRSRRKILLLLTAACLTALLLLSACSASDCIWMPEALRDRPLQGFTLSFSQGEVVKASSHIFMEDGRVQEIRWQRDFSGPVLEPGRALDWKEPLHTPFTPNTTLPLCQAVVRWMKENRPSYPDYSLYHFGSYPSEMAEKCAEYLSHARERDKTVFTYSLSQQALALWEQDTLPQDLEGWAILDGWDGQAQLFYPIFLVS